MRLRREFEGIDKQSEAIPEITLARSDRHLTVMGPGEVGGENWPGFRSSSDGHMGFCMIPGKVRVASVGEIVGVGGEVKVKVESDGVEGEEEKKYF